MNADNQDKDKVLSAIAAAPRARPDRQVSLELEEYLLYLRSPWRMMWVNLVVVVAGILWLLSLTGSVPLIGQHMRSLHNEFSALIAEVSYTDDFERIEALLEKIAVEMSDESASNETVQPACGSVSRDRFIACVINAG